MPGVAMRWFVFTTTAVVAAAIVLVAVFFAGEEAPPHAGTISSGANTLLVDRVDAERLLVGTGDGVFESVDGGRSWRRTGLEGREVVALARVKDGTVWAGGRGLLARSSDAGRSWTAVSPRGLPRLDVRALSGSRDVGGRLEAGIGGAGLFRSNDGGRIFAKLGPSDVGGEARALAETVDGVIFVSDERTGVIANSSGDGVEWIEVRSRSVRALAPNYADRRDGLLLAGSEDGVLRTTDKGQSWDNVLSLEGGATAVAFSQSTVGIAYALDRGGVTYRSADFGATWMATR